MLLLEGQPAERQRVPDVPCRVSARRRDGDRGRCGTLGRRAMPRHQLLSLAGAPALLGSVAWAGDARAADAAAGTEVTGIVTQADKQAGWIVVDGQTYTLSQKGGGDVGLPAVGSKVALAYQERDGQKVITKLGQAKQ